MLVNERTGAAIATVVEHAATRATRRRGLLGRDRLEPQRALILEPCAAIHTAFMRFAIDVVFVDRQGRAVKIVRDVPPWRMAIAAGAHSVVEMAAGSLAPDALRVGDRLVVKAAV